MIGKLATQECLQSIVLPSPCDGTDRVYFFDDDTNCVFEIKEFNINYCSWLIDKILQQRNSVKFLTKYDPTYILLGLLDDTVENNRMRIISDLLTSEKYPALRLLKMLDEKLITNVCQWKPCDEEIACKIDIGMNSYFCSANIRKLYCSRIRFFRTSENFKFMKFACSVTRFLFSFDFIPIFHALF